jgi:hypothetical protein
MEAVVRLSLLPARWRPNDDVERASVPQLLSGCRQIVRSTGVWHVFGGKAETRNAAIELV